jgi:hypothetical protein
MRNQCQRRKVIPKEDGKAFAEWHGPEREDPEREYSEDEGDEELSVTKKQMSRWIKEVRQESHLLETGAYDSRYIMNQEVEDYLEITIILFRQSYSIFNHLAGAVFLDATSILLINPGNSVRSGIDFGTI